MLNETNKQANRLDRASLWSKIVLSIPYRTIFMNKIALKQISWTKWSVFFLVPFLALAVTVHASPRDQTSWNSKYDKEVYIYGKEPVAFLKANVGLLPKGKALELAMGEGRNGVFLATQGFQVLGLDISDVGLQKAHSLAWEKGVEVETRVVDLEDYTLPRSEYDVVVCTFYLQRNLFRQIKATLKSGGMVVFQTYNVDYLKYADFPKKYVLETNELLEIFEDYKIIRYESFDDGKEAYSSIIAQKP